MSVPYNSNIYNVPKDSRIQSSHIIANQELDHYWLKESEKVKHFEEVYILGRKLGRL